MWCVKVSRQGFKSREVIAPSQYTPHERGKTISTGYHANYWLDGVDRGDISLLICLIGATGKRSNS
jgi:hypothetical protein